MNLKFYLYILVVVFVMIGMDSLNINHLFKKNKIYQARIFYILVSFALTYLVVNFIYEFYEASKIL